MTAKASAPRSVAVIGAGPAGLFAAERIAAAGHRVAIYERLPSPARKLLMAGRGGLNLTHSEPLARFTTRYGGAAPWLATTLDRMPPDALRAWAEGLGQETFVGSSGRVFPRAMKASPLLRAWLARLAGLGVTLHASRRWTGWTSDGRLRCLDPSGTEHLVAADAVVLALGGASWPRLGSDGTWTTPLGEAGIAITSLEPANAAVLIPWTDHVMRHAGTPLKRIAVRLAGEPETDANRGEAVITKTGLEGGAVYALNPRLRAALRAGPATLLIDLRPDLDASALSSQLARGKAKQSLSTLLSKAAKLPPAAIAVLRDGHGTALPRAPAALAAAIKAVPLRVTALASLARAISTAGGIARDALDDRFMLKARPGVFAAGEMLDWDAPTGGYLLQATFATANAAADGVIAWLSEQAKSRLPSG